MARKNAVKKIDVTEERPVIESVDTKNETGFSLALIECGYTVVKESMCIYVSIDIDSKDGVDAVFKRVAKIAKDVNYRGSFGVQKAKRTNKDECKKD